MATVTVEPTQQAHPPGLSSDGPILRRLRRVTSSTTYIPVIDGWRFVAIMWVVMGHLLETIVGEMPRETIRSSPLLWFADQGQWGVRLFFVISGFVIALPFAKAAETKKRVSIRKYFTRRLTRLEPPFVIAILLIYSAQVAKGLIGLGDRLPELIATLTYSHGLFYHKMSIINAVTWSLEVEVQFYILAPLLASVFLIRSDATRRLVLLAAILIGAVLRTELLAADPWFRLTVLGNFAYFFAGFLLADLHGRRAVPRDPAAGFAIDLLATACVGGVIMLLSLKQVWATNLLTPLLLAGAIDATLRGGWFRRFLSLPWLTAIGGMCYTIYLYHFQVMRRCVTPASRVIPDGVGLDTQFLLTALAVIPAIIFVCGILFVLFEKPFMYPDGFQRIVRRLRGRYTGGE